MKALQEKQVTWLYIHDLSVAGSREFSSDSGTSYFRILETLSWTEFQ